MKHMNIYYTDGSAVPNPGQAGFAVILNGKPVALGCEEHSTNIRMEGQALVAAIKHASQNAKGDYEIHTDSEFWLNVLNKWAAGWAAKGWRKGKKNEPIANLDIVQELYELFLTHQPKLVWTRGHVGTVGNELADEWANKARIGATL
jgi:ribonuclease HI